MEIPYTREELTEATLEVIRRNDLDGGYIRPIAFYGYDSLGVSPKGNPTEVAIAAWPWGTYLGEDALENGVDVMVSSWRKHASSQIPTNAKTTGLYVNSMLAGEEARRNGYVEAIVLNKEGNVAEGPGENIFMVRDGKIYTPGLSQSILDGITRDTVITLARERGYEVDDARLSLAASCTPPTNCSLPVPRLRSRPSERRRQRDRRGDEGAVTDELQSAFFDVIESGDREEWFHYV